MGLSINTQMRPNLPAIPSEKLTEAEIRKWMTDISDAINDIVLTIYKDIRAIIEAEGL